MLVSQQNTWLDQLALLRRSAGMRIWPRLLAVFGFAAAVTLAHHWLDGFSAALTPLPFSMLGVALGIFLGFRNSASYDRFWEGRKLWGELVNLSRSWARQVLTLIERDAERPTPRQRELVLGVVVFAHVLRQHLRDQRDVAELGELPARAGCAATVVARHRPNATAQWLGERLADAARAGVVDPFHVPTLDHTLSGFTNVLGACERIKNTPIPGSYSVLIHRIVALYVFGLPFGMVASTGIFTPLVVLFVAYAFLGLDAIGGEIENPFGLDPNDLPLAALSRTIEIDLRELLGETELPPPAAAVGGILH
jgi:ion channel-forming bestrophin family protein